jgi:hypothetical protein
MTPDVALQIHGMSQIVSQTILNEDPNKPFWKLAKKRMASLLSVLCTNTCVAMVWIELSNTHGRVRYLSRLKFGCGLFVMMLLTPKIIF